MKFFLVVLHSFCQIFHVDMFRVNYPGAIFCVFWFPGYYFLLKGAFMEWSRNWLSIKSYKNERLLRRYFQAESSARNLAGREDSQRGWNCLVGNLMGRVHILLDEISTERISGRERGIFHRGWARFTGIIWKTKIKCSLYEELPPPQYLALYAKVWMLVHIFNSGYWNTGAV